MKRSFRRILAVRFAGTMVVGLVAVTLLYRSPLWAVGPHALLAHLAIVLGVSGACLLGVWVVTGSAVRPLREITDYATHIEAGSLDHERIVAHADTEEFSGLVAVLNRMLERLDAAFRTQRRLVADVSHELRTPLAALQGEIEVALRAERSPREYQLVLRSALEEIDRLTTLSEDLLLLTRAEAHLLEVQRRPMDPNAMLRRELSRLQRRIEEKDLTVLEALDAAAQSVSVDPTLVSRLIGHLLDNATKYAPIGGRVVVSSEAQTTPPCCVRLAIENSGPQIEAADLPHIFEPFYRADRARTRGTGAGLGLALAAAIVRLHGGAIRARNQNGNGVRFEVDLPAAIP